MSSFQSMTDGSVCAAGRSKYATVSCETLVVELDPGVRQQRRRPGSCGDDGEGGLDRPARGLERTPSSSARSARTRTPFSIESPRREGGERPVGPDDAAVELEHDLAFELDAETPSGFSGVEHLVLRRAGVERRP